MSVFNTGKKYQQIVFLIISFIYVFLPQKTLALIKMNDPIKEALGASKLTTVDSVVNMALSILITVGSLVVFGFFAIGGIMYFFSVGNEQQENKAKKMLIDAAIGFVMLVAAYALANWAVNYVNS